MATVEFNHVSKQDQVLFAISLFPGFHILVEGISQQKTNGSANMRQCETHTSTLLSDTGFILVPQLHE